MNRRYGRTGTLWVGRYRTRLVQSEHYLIACQRYIELDPVRTGIVTRPSPASATKDVELDLFHS